MKNPPLLVNIFASVVILYLSRITLAIRFVSRERAFSIAFVLLLFILFFVFDQCSVSRVPILLVYKLHITAVYSGHTRTKIRTNNFKKKFAQISELKLFFDYCYEYL